LSAELAAKAGMPPTGVSIQNKAAIIMQLSLVVLGPCFGAGHFVVDYPLRIRTWKSPLGHKNSTSRFDEELASESGRIRIFCTSEGGGVV
jgi:hypothetical protein